MCKSLNNLNLGHTYANFQKHDANINPGHTYANFQKHAANIRITVIW